MNTLPSKIHDHNTGLDYTLVGDYYLPDLKPFEVPPLGKYGRMRLHYLKEHRPCTHTVGTVKYYAQIRLQVWQNKVCTRQGTCP